MKHYRFLFMMLALLVMGVSNVWGQTTYTYRVLYENGVIEGGYTIKSGATSTVNALKRTVNGTEYSDYAVLESKVELSNDNINSYIEAITDETKVGKNNASIYVDTNDTEMGYNGVIYINYNYKSTVTPQSWDDGIFTYSNIYTMTENQEGTIRSKIYLGENAVAVSLKLTKTSVTEDATFYRYRMNYGSEWNPDWAYYDLKGNTYYLTGSKNTCPLADDNETRLSYGTTQRDDPDGDDGEKIIYTYKSQSDDWVEYSQTASGKTVYRKAFTYSRTWNVGLSTATTAEIPAKYGNKDVVAIQKWGFCYKKDHTLSLYNCGEDDINPDYSKGDRSSQYYTGTGYEILRTNDHGNDYLTQVTFAPDCQIKSIGDYAFMSCTVLEKIQGIPYTVANLGQGAFEVCQVLNELTFQTGNVTRFGETFNGVNFRTIRSWTFWLCSGLQTLILPDGIEWIEGQTSGSSMQYLSSLINVRLPNTLKRVGPHFLCSAQSLRTLTVPVSVEYLDGACFHGCGSLETVYILGPAATLKYTTGGDDDSGTFSANITGCADPVNQCVFYTTYNNLSGYQNDPVWSKIDNEGEWLDPNHNNGYSNWLKVMTEKRRIPEYWVTAMFPYGVSDVEASFGEGTLVAELEKCTGVTSQTVNNKRYRVYHLQFKLVEGNTIDRHKPVLIKAGDDSKPEYEFYTSEQTKTNEFATNSTLVFSESVTYGEATISMKGQYFEHLLAPGDFYFTYRQATKDENGNITVPGDPKFYVVENQQAAPMIKGCRCWWDIVENGLQQTNVSAKPASARFFDETTGIDDVETKVVIDAIYDLNGHKLDVKPEELPQGMFIINGKKVLKK